MSEPGSAQTLPALADPGERIDMAEVTCSTEGCTDSVLWSGLCRRCYKRAEYQRNKQRYIERAARWAAENPDLARKYKREHEQRKRVANPAEARARARTSMQKWRRDNVNEARAKNRADYQKNSEKRIAAVTAWAKANPERFRAIQRNRALRVRNAPGSGVSFDTWESMLAIVGRRCFYCDKSDGPLQMEHMTPLVRGGWHQSFNVVPSCPRCNQRKATMTAEEFVMRMVHDG